MFLTEKSRQLWQQNTIPSTLNMYKMHVALSVFLEIKKLSSSENHELTPLFTTAGGLADR